MPRLHLSRFPAARVLSLAAALTVAATIARAEDADAKAGLPVDRGVGQRIANYLPMKDVRTGEELPLRAFLGKKAAVMIFTGVGCPVGDLYMPRIAELAKSYGPKGVAFVLINSNASDTVEEIAAQAKQFGLDDVPVVKDPGNQMADLLLAERTCEAIVVDTRLDRQHTGMVRYRGAIDDQYVVGARKPEPTRSFLADALDALLAGEPVKLAATPVEGCLIERAPAAPRGPKPRLRGAAPEIVAALADAEDVEVGDVTYAGHVAEILQRKCQQCHRPDQTGPFSLLTYDDARRRAGMIAEVVDERRMPPWHADPRYGHFANDRSLSPRERATLLAWVEQGTPLGDPAKIPADRTFVDGWTMGSPDVVFEMPQEYVVPAQGEVSYQRFLVPTHFEQDMWVQAAEARPGDRSVVHHIIVYVVDPKNQLDRKTDGHLCGYAPGDLPSVYPDGVAKKVPAGSSLLFEVHYTPIGTIRTDRSKVGLIFAKQPPKHWAHTFPIANGKFTIPPGAGNHPVEASHTFDQDITLLSFMPHMHLRGKSFRYTVTLPGGEPRVLLSVPAYDFAWQSYYTLAEPLKLPKGSRIDCLAHFDNSDANPYNPDPAATVKWGDQTREEMMIGYIDYYDDADRTAPEKVAAEPKADDRPRSPLRQLLRAARQAGRDPGSN